MTNDETNNAEAQAKAQVRSICEMVAALECDFERLDELREERDAWREENPGRYLEPNDPRDLGRWALACPDEAEELAELESAAGDCADRDEAETRIQEDPLSVEVRSDWCAPGESMEAGEFRILLCTGGPHVELVGDLDRGEPSRVRVLYKDWGESGEYYPDSEERAALETYCAQFHFGE